MVATSQTRSRQNSLTLALTDIQERVDNLIKAQYNNNLASDRKSQVGTGMRGDKIRTYRFQDDSVQDHITGKRGKCNAILKGNFELLWN